MYTIIIKRDEVKNLPPEETINICNEKLRSLHERQIPLKAEMKAIDDEVNYWWLLKREESIKLSGVKKIPYGVSGKDNHNHKMLDLDKFLTKLTDVQKRKIMADLLKLQPVD